MDNLGEVKSPPSDYVGWVSFLENIENNIRFIETEGFFEGAVCPEYAAVKVYFHKYIENAVNTVIRQSVTELQKNIRRCVESNEISSLHLAFVRFSKKVKNCTFFVKIPFVDEDYKNELLAATKLELDRFRSSMLESLSSDVKKSGSSFLEEELFLIKKIKLL